MRLSDLGQIDSLKAYYQEYKRNEQIAEKVLLGKRLNKSEKEEIYLLLTGKEPATSVKRGRPSTIERDFKLAVDYLNQKAGKKRIDLLRLNLAKKHGLLRQDGTFRENTFYIALNRGIADWHDLATWWLDHYYKGGFSGRDESENKMNVERMKRALKLIGDYREAGIKLQKKMQK